jgi:hypothetical protein
MRSYDYDLGRDRLLRIQTNITDGEERGLDDLVALVKRCYSYVEATTNLPIKRGVLLYLIEFDEIPTAYSFSASYDDASKWAEVRLALVKRDEALYDKSSMSSLSDLLYDTLPHELGHDVLDSIPQLLHDVDGNPSYHTRWFIEGVCEVLAKGFSQREAPALYRRFLSLRKVDSVLAESTIQTDMLNWSQRNDNGVVLESELYGASMLTVMAWNKSQPLGELLDDLSSRTSRVRGVDLLAMMQKATGESLSEMVKRGHVHGQQLNDSVVLATLLD